LRTWDKRKKIYEEKGDLDKVLTTDELHGISDAKILAIIEAIVRENLASEDVSNRYSRCHYSLR